MDTITETKTPPPFSGTRDTLIVCRNSQGVEVRATALRLTRYLVVFEVYNPYSILQLSEVLSDFQIIMNERVVYSGRGVVSNLVNAGIVLVCEVALEESWLDLDLFSPVGRPGRLKGEFAEFMKEWEKTQTVRSDFKVVVADMQTMLVDLRRWLEQVELGIRSSPTGDRQQMEREAVAELGGEIVPAINGLFAQFEGAADSIQTDLQPLHRMYMRRQLHPLVLCSPFAYRTYHKPLGYAGDYEMVNMILRDPLEGSSLFAKTLNLWFLEQAPARAHRNRIVFLKQRLAEEIRRVTRLGRTARIYNLGCGPAAEVQGFLTQDDLSERAAFTLMDFNDETLQYTAKLLDDLRARYRRATQIQMVKKSVHQLLKESGRPNESAVRYDFIYCAGLFDYLSDRICKRLMDYFYEMLAPGGLLTATNVDPSNPLRRGMEYLLEWHLVYRNKAQLESLTPSGALPEHVQSVADNTGVNVFLEVRKPNGG